MKKSRTKEKLWLLFSYIPILGVIISFIAIERYYSEKKVEERLAALTELVNTPKKNWLSETRENPFTGSYITVSINMSLEEGKGYTKNPVPLYLVKKEENDHKEIYFALPKEDFTTKANNHYLQAKFNNQAEEIYDFTIRKEGDIAYLHLSQEDSERFLLSLDTTHTLHIGLEAKDKLYTIVQFNTEKDF